MNPVFILVYRHFQAKINIFGCELNAALYLISN